MFNFSLFIFFLFCLVFGIESMFIINESKPVDKDCFKNGILFNEWRHLSNILTKKKLFAGNFYMTTD